MTSLWSLPWCSTWHGPPSCLQVMVFMGGTLRLSGREGFSNPDRSVEDRPWRRKLHCPAVVRRAAGHCDRRLAGNLGPGQTDPTRRAPAPEPLERPVRLSPVGGLLSHARAV